MFDKKFKISQEAAVFQKHLKITKSVDSKWLVKIENI